MLSASPKGIKETFFAPRIREAFFRSTLIFPGMINKTKFPSLVEPTRFFVSWFRSTPVTFEASEVWMVSGLAMNLCQIFFDSRNSSSFNQTNPYKNLWKIKNFRISKFDSKKDFD